GHLERLLPWERRARARMVGRSFGAIIPAPHAVPAIGHPGSRHAQERPVDGAAHAFRCVWLFGLISNVVPIRGFEVNKWPVRQTRPIVCRRPIREPLERLVVISMPALIAHHVVPFLVFEFFPNPLHAPWLKRDWRMGNASEDGPPDVFPTFRFLRPIIPISGQDPEH